MSKLTKGMTHKWIVSLQLVDWLGFQNKRQNVFVFIVLDSVFNMFVLEEVIERTRLPAGPHELDPGNWELLTLSTGEGNGNPLQYSCLENLMDRGAYRATVHGVARVRHDIVTKLPPPPYSLSVKYSAHHSTNRIHFHGCRLERAMCNWDHLDNMRNWTLLRPLYKLLWFWQQVLRSTCLVAGVSSLPY